MMPQGLPDLASLQPPVRELRRLSVVMYLTGQAITTQLEALRVGMRPPDDDQSDDEPGPVALSDMLSQMAAELLGKAGDVAGVQISTNAATKKEEG